MGGVVNGVGRACFVWVLVVMLMGLPLRARALFGAGDIVSDPLSYTYYVSQISQAVEQTLQLKQQFENLQQQLEAQNLMTMGLDAVEWEDVTAHFMQLSQLTDVGQAVSYAMGDVAEQFNTTYPGYSAPEHYAASYQQWNRATLDAIRNSFTSAGLQHNEFATESAKLHTLANLSQSAKGQTQAIQAGNLIANHLATQLQKLRHLTMSQLQAQNAYMAYEVNKDAASDAVFDRLFREVKIEDNHPGY